MSCLAWESKLFNSVNNSECMKQHCTPPLSIAYPYCMTTNIILTLLVISMMLSCKCFQPKAFTAIYSCWTPYCTANHAAPTHFQYIIVLIRWITVFLGKNVFTSYDKFSLSEFLWCTSSQYSRDQVSESYNCFLDKYKQSRPTPTFGPQWWDSPFHKAFQHNSIGRKELSLSWALPVSFTRSTCFSLVFQLIRPSCPLTLCKEHTYTCSKATSRWTNFPTNLLLTENPSLGRNWTGVLSSQEDYGDNDNKLSLTHTFCSFYTHMQQNMKAKIRWSSEFSDYLEE